MPTLSQSLFFVLLHALCAYSTLYGTVTEETCTLELGVPWKTTPSHTKRPHAYPPYWNEKETPIMQALKSVTIDEEPPGLDGIDCLYLINLDRRPERLARMQTLLSEYGLHAQRFDAVDGQALTLKTKNTLFGPYRICMTNGAIGCLLSHLSILQDAYERGFACIWVLEDDVNFLENPHILPSLLHALQAHDPEWDLFFTDTDSKNSQGQRFLPPTSKFRPNQPERPLSYYHKKERIGPYFFRIQQRLGTWSMFLSRKGIKKILDYYRHVYLWSPYDIDLYYAQDLHTYTPQRDIVTHIIENRTSDTIQ